MFEYRPIRSDRIRLLQVVSIDPGLEILLDSFPVADCPPYIALSYAWGDTADKVECECNGVPFNIGPSLYNAICNIDIYHPDGTWYWADAICINQDDELEKALLVSKMSQVYRRAVETAVWLGSSENDSDLALTQIRSMATAILAHKELWSESLTVDDYRKAANNAGIPDASDAIWVAILQLFGRPWFSRLWIVQEIALSETIHFHCGAKCMNWYGLGACAWMLSRQWMAFKSHLEQTDETLIDSVVGGVLFVFLLDQVCQRQNWAATGWGILFMLLRAQNASEKLDYVYGVHALLPDSMQEKLEVNYSVESKMAYRDLHAKFFALVLRETGAITTACFTRTIGYRDPELPSWCPDWVTKNSDRASGMLHTRKGNAGRVPTPGNASSALNSTGGSEMASNSAPEAVNDDYRRHETESQTKGLSLVSQVQAVSMAAIPAFKVDLSSDSRVLTLGGACFDIIDEVLSHKPLTDTDTRAVYVCECIDQLLGFMARDPEIRPRIPAIITETQNWRRIGNYIGYEGDDILADLLQSLKASHTKNEEHILSANTEDKNDSQLKMLYGRILSGASLSIPVRVFARTRQRRFGSVPGTTKPGDIVCVFFNADSPHVLTPPDSKGYHKMIGPAFVDGVMDGELFLSSQKPQLEPKDIHLI